nr:MAG TPA: hypothetical protein [Caudoviricetes sp.]
MEALPFGFLYKPYFCGGYGFLYKQSLFSMSARPRLDAKPHPPERGIDCIENNRKTHCITTHYIKWGG